MSDLDFKIALEKFPLAPWLTRRGFEPQGRAKQEFVHDCPFCGAEDKLSVNAARRFWRCFRCAKPFGLLDLIAAFEGGYAHALEVVRIASGGRSLAMIPEDSSAPLGVVRPSTWEPWPIAPPESFAPLTDHVEYTRRRGLDLKNLRALGAGICSWGHYQDRIVFPVRRWDGQWLYFQSRATWEKSEHVGTRKYRKNLNPANADPARHASAADVLLGLELALAGRYSRVAVVEGPTDWTQSGPDAVALLGKVLSDRQLMLLVRAGVREIDLCLDPDVWYPPSVVDTHGRVQVLDRPPPGKVVADRLAAHFMVRVVRYAEGTDPGSFSVAENRAFRARAVPWGTGARLSFIP